MKSNSRHHASFHFSVSCVYYVGMDRIDFRLCKKWINMYIHIIDDKMHLSLLKLLLRSAYVDLLSLLSDILAENMIFVL